MNHIHEDDGTVEGCPGCFGDLDRVLGTECPACGDTYHNLGRHLELNYKGCATTAICTCQILDAPGLHEDFGGGVRFQVQVLKIDPGCAVHTGPPNPLCHACTDDDGSCVCTRPCGAVTCTGGL